MIILGIIVGHDSAASLVIDGEIVADVAEERFSRIKNDASFPLKSIEYCLNVAGITSLDLDAIAIPTCNLQDEIGIFFDLSNLDVKGYKKDKYSLAKKLIRSFLKSKSKIVLPRYQSQFKLSEKCKLHFIDHHESHISSAYYTGGYALNERILGITLDGIGDGTSGAVWQLENNKIQSLKRFDRSGSLAWFYGNATEAMGWRHASEEWKVMGLAPYGKPVPGALEKFHPHFKSGELIKPFHYSKFGTWNERGGNHYHNDASIPMSKVFDELGSEDFAAEVQRISEEQAEQIIIPWIKKTGLRKLCVAGGFFMNVKFNQKLWETGELDDLWIYPNPGDAGLALGAALNVYYNSKNNSSKQTSKLQTVYTGPEYTNEEIEKILNDRMIAYEKPKSLCSYVADKLSKGMVIGWFQGRMEAGPRALGNRSILMSPIDQNAKDRINAKVKYREGFRPFCPSILDNYYSEYLETSRSERFMVSSFRAKEGMNKRIPAVIHVDGTARPQLVRKKDNPKYYELIKEFGKLTKEFVLLNTSFNIKGEPIVCNPREAIKCFYDTGLDVLVLGDYVIEKSGIE